MVTRKSKSAAEVANPLKELTSQLRALGNLEPTCRAQRAVKGLGFRGSILRALDQNLQGYVGIYGNSRVCMSSRDMQGYIQTMEDY